MGNFVIHEVREDGIEEKLDLLQVDFGAASKERQGRPQGKDRPPLEVTVTSGAQNVQLRKNIQL